MLRRYSDRCTQELADQAQAPRADWSLQVTLWSVWTFVVIGFATFHWYADISAQRPVDLLGLVIRTVLVGLFGLIVMTLVEMRVEPERFLN